MSLKKKLIAINNGIAELLHLSVFFSGLLVDCPKKPFKYRKTHSGTLAVLANGPSLKEVLKRIHTSGEFENVEFSVMNFFACTPDFKKLKPKFYCLVDPMFCIDTHHIDNVRKTFKALQDDVDWEMTLYIPSYYRMSRFLSFSGIDNPKIKIVVLNSSLYLGSNPDIFRWLYRKGLTIPRNTVAQTCIYTGINNGFENIRLYGMEHTFFHSLTLNNENRLCWVEEHFYDDKRSLKPILKNSNGENYKISEYLAQKANLFKVHDMLSYYAKSVGCHIVNCTPITLIDSYEREP